MYYLRDTSIRTRIKTTQSEAVYQLRYIIWRKILLEQGLRQLQIIESRTFWNSGLMGPPLEQGLEQVLDKFVGDVVIKFNVYIH